MLLVFLFYSLFIFKAFDLIETVSLCSQTVFASLDYLQTWVHSKMKLQPTAKSKPMKSTIEYGYVSFNYYCEFYYINIPIIGSLNIPIVENFLKSIPKVGNACIVCHYNVTIMFCNRIC